MSASTTPAARDPRDLARAALRRVEEQLELAERSPALREAWSALVATLALGPAPELRTCPACGNTGRRAATRCGYCWAALPPLADAR